MWQRLKDIVATTAADHNNSSKIIGVTPAALIGGQPPYSATVDYEVGDRVYHPTSAYVYTCIKDGTGQRPDLSREYWEPAEVLFSITSEDLVQKAISNSTTVQNVFNTQMGSAISSDSTLQNIFNTQVGTAISTDSNLQTIFNTQVSNAIQGDTTIQGDLSTYINEHNRQITIQQLEAAGFDEATLLDPTEVINVDPNEGGGVRAVSYTHLRAHET